jgi:hypothetical protein
LLYFYFPLLFKLNHCSLEGQFFHSIKILEIFLKFGGFQITYLSGGFRKSGGFQRFILEFSAGYSLPGGFQETNLLGLALC